MAIRLPCALWYPVQCVHLCLLPALLNAEGLGFDLVGKNLSATSQQDILKIAKGFEKGIYRLRPVTPVW